MSQIRSQAPQLDPASLYSDSRDAAEIADELRAFARRLYRASRTTTAEHRQTVNVLNDLDILLDRIAHHSGQAFDAIRHEPF